MLRGLFVTGTDTGVGKTVVSAALMRRFRRDAPLRYWKPIQTGIEQDDDTAEVGRLVAAGGHTVTLGRTILRAETAGVVAPALVISEMHALHRRTDQAQA